MSIINIINLPITKLPQQLLSKHNQQDFQDWNFIGL